jgi:two-component system CheB/CheR fusion protein
VVVIRDITERSLRILQEEFAALAGHELRTPLTVVTGHLHIMAKALKNRPDSERLLRNVNIALTQSKRLAALITDLVDVSRLQTGKFRLQHVPVELDTLLGQVVEMAQALTESQTIVLTAQDGPIVVSGDASRLQQVVLNLLNNAITYAPSSERIDVRLRLAGNMAEIEVQDYGQGIKPEHMARLFSRFYQVADGTQKAGHGLGLGLFISRQIVTGHNGTITARSAPGEGTTFTIHLPLLEQEDPLKM